MVSIMWADESGQGVATSMVKSSREHPLFGGIVGEHPEESRGGRHRNMYDVLLSRLRLFDFVCRDTREGFFVKLNHEVTTNKAPRE